MTELAFLSADFENEENGEDEVTVSNIPPFSSSNMQIKGSVTDSVATSKSDSNVGQGTVEICQKTVNPNSRVNCENFKIQRVIGKGGYGKVFLVQKVDGFDAGKLYAMKVLKKARLVCNEKDKAHTVSERNILEMLKHPFLVKLHYAFQNHSNLYIVLEYCPGGELFNYLEREGALLENAACFYTSEIVLAIGHLHSLGIIYRDLKSENVLLDRQGHVKLTDFGLSKEGVCTTNTFCGTIEYMAPEIIKCEGHGKAVDWWSLGTLIFDMLSGGPPFSQEESREATTHKILNAPLRFPPSFSPEVSSLIRGLLKRDPKERLGSREDVEEIKRHKFFRRHEINWSDVFHRRLKPPFRPKLVSENDVSMFDPSFTRLQPVVSPGDTGRPIPPDMFQGFSYVAPSVWEDSIRNSWTENTSNQRRQWGSRGTISAGRLRRIGTENSDWFVKITEAMPTQNLPLPSVVSDFNQSSNIQDSNFKLPYQNSVSPTFSSDVPNMRNKAEVVQSFLTLSTNINSYCENSFLYEKPKSSLDQCYVPVDDTIEEANVEDEEEEEIEEENVPGAKQIHAYNSCYKSICTNNLASGALPNVNKIQRSSFLGLDRPNTVHSSQESIKQSLPYSTNNRTGIKSERKHEPFNSFETGSMKATQSSGNKNAQRPQLVIHSFQRRDFPVSSTLSSNVITTNIATTNGAANSKCIIM